MAAGVARDSLDHTRNLIEEVFYTPKTSTRKSCLFHVGSSIPLAQIAPFGDIP
jgi:hypothetical protein